MGVSEESTFSVCRSLSLPPSRGRIGSIGVLWLEKGTLFRNNIASEYRHILTRGQAYYRLPLEPGFWLPNAECLVNREPTTCNPGPSEDNCRADAISCTMLVGDSSNSYRPRAPFGATCEAPTLVQQCDWLSYPELITNPPSKIYTIPSSISINDPEFPFACAPGILGSADEAYQTSPACAGKCPAGWYCPFANTTSEIACTTGSFCPTGSSNPLPCAAGSYLNLTNATSQADCFACPTGSSCATGSSTPSACAPGTVSAQAGMSECTNCVAGKFQSNVGATACRDCIAGASARLDPSTSGSPPPSLACLSPPLLTQCSVDRHPPPQDGHFTDMLFYRVLPGFLIQFGIAADPAQQRKWDYTVGPDGEKVWTNPPLADEPNRAKFRAGSLSFAGAGENTRSCHLFIAMEPFGSQVLGAGPHETTIGFVDDGLDKRVGLGDGLEVMDRICRKHKHHGYPDTGSLQEPLIEHGNAAAAEYPELDRILSAEIIEG